MVLGDLHLFQDEISYLVLFLLVIGIFLFVSRVPPVERAGGKSS